MQNRNTGSQAPSSVAGSFVSKINPKPEQKDYKTPEMTVEDLRQYDVGVKDLRKYEAVERLAAIDHDQWVFWSQRIMRELDELITTIDQLDKRLLVVDKNYRGSPAHQLARKMFDKHTARNDRWESQWCIYSKLPEEVKEHDRLWAKKAYEAMNK
jgi:hypothetical protein